jgi:hypothetical protein
MAESEPVNAAEEASAVPSGGGASIAAHVDHLRYGLELLNRWTRGEKPFADADHSVRLAPGCGVGGPMGITASCRLR